MRELPDSAYELLETGGAPTAFMVWRTGCSTSRLAIPYWQRLHELYPQVNVIAFCQDDAPVGEAYARGEGLLLPMAYGDHSMRLSRSLQVQTVPAFWVLDRAGDVVLEGIAWNRSVFEDANALLASLAGVPQKTLFRPDDDVPEFKPG